MQTVIKKWGNSLGIRIPKYLVKDFSLKDGSIVDIDENDNKIVISSKNNLSLDTLLNEINENNLHPEIDSGNPVGNEIW